MEENEKLAYLAGLVDGEGCITIVKCKEKRTKQGFRFFPLVVITNSSKDLIENVRDIIGFGRIYFRKESSRWRKLYQLKIQDMKNIIGFLEGILPFLILKKEQAEILINFCRSRINLYRGRGRKAPYTEEEFSWYEQVRKLNT